MPGSQLEPVAPALHALHLVVLSHIQLEVLRHLAVVGQGLPPSRFVGGGDEWHAADLELVGRREERHVQGIAHQARDHGPLDRKSTRLNSSHVSISYAVFCLKKKRSK